MSEVEAEPITDGEKDGNAAKDEKTTAPESVDAGFTFDFSSAEEEYSAPAVEAPQIDSVPEVKAEQIPDVSAFDDFDDFGDFEDIEVEAPAGISDVNDKNNGGADAISDDDIASSISGKIAAMRNSSPENGNGGIFDDTLGEPEAITEAPTVEDSDASDSESGGFDFDFSVFENTPAPRPVHENDAKKKRRNRKKK